MSSRQKIAMIMSGDLRCFKECYEFTRKNIIEVTNCDIYMHTYKCPEAIDAILLYNPKAIIINEKSEKYNKKIKEICKIHKDPVTHVDNVMNMWKNIKLSFDLIEEEYDLIIKSRYDLIINEKINLNNIKSEFINIPIGYDFRDGLNDLFAIGNLSNMKYYCNMIKKIEKYNEKEKILFHPETLLKHHLKIKNVNRFKLSLFIKR